MFNQWFGLSQNQLRFVALLCLSALVMGGYLLIDSWAYPAKDTEPLPLFESGPENGLRGILQVDLNSAPVDSLELLDGIGPQLAARIVSYRVQRPFGSVEDLLKVNGIGPATLESLRPFVKVTPYE